MSTETARRLHRWSDEQETRRRNLVAAGIVPTFYRWWASDITGDLIAARVEYLAKYDALVSTMGHDEVHELLDQLALEIAYRMHHTVRQYEDVEHHDTGKAAHNRAAELTMAYGYPFHAAGRTVVVAP